MWESEGRPPSRLLAPGRPLAEGEDLLATRHGDLDPDQITFIEASVAAEKERREKERAAARKRLTRARTVAAAMAAMALASIVLGYLFYQRSMQEQEARLEAQTQTRLAQEQRQTAKNSGKWRRSSAR